MSLAQPAPAVLPRDGHIPRTHLIALAILVLALLAAPVAFYPIFLMKALCFALFACAFNLLLGYCGLMSFGHAAYFGIGSYVGAYVAKSWGLTPELAIIAGTSAGAGLGLVFGWIAIRKQGLYFAMITMALAQLAYFFCLQAPFTGGEDGIQNVPRGALFGLISLKSDLAAYGLAAGVFLIGFVLIYRIVHSPFGQVLKAIRENEQRAISLGYPTQTYKLVVFVLSAGLAGAAGATKAIVLGLATLNDVNFTTSGDVVLASLVGGLGTLFGPMVGALVIAGMEHVLAPLGSWITVIQGAVFVGCVLAFRRGIVGSIEAGLRKKTKAGEA